MDPGVQAWQGHACAGGAANNAKSSKRLSYFMTCLIKNKEAGKPYRKIIMAPVP
jgi:hypothetical protein